MGTARTLLSVSGIGPRRAGASVALGTLTILCGVGLMATSGYLISRAAERPPVLELSVAIAMVRFFGLARPAARYLDRLWSHDVALRGLGRIRARFYESIEPLAPARLEGFRRGDLLTRMVADVDSLQGLYLRGVGPGLTAIAAGAVCVGVVAAVLPAAALVLAAGLLVGGIAVPLVAVRLAGDDGGRRAAARARLTADLVQLFRSGPELAVYGAQERTLGEIRSADGELAALARRDALRAGLGEGLSVLVAGLTVVGVLAVAVAARHAGTLDRVLVGAVALAALASFESVAPLPGAARELRGMLAAGRRVLELGDREPVVRDPASPLAPPADATVALEGVTVRYREGDRPALAGVDLRLDPGRRVALVGPSGAGKTTVVNLLLRFLDPEAGRATLAGRDVREYREEDVRAVFAYAGQDAHIFDSSIRENVKLGRPGASDDDIVAALRRARLDGWVARLPHGLDTLVGEEGEALSGGQRQRLTLARALLSAAPVLLLDEPTAHLDPETAGEIVRDVLDAAAGRSVLLITHRSEGLELVDEVVVLAEGRVAA
jgi:thiol reductant ABC exporter CydC subunit